MAISKNKGSVAYSIQGSSDAPVKNAESNTQAAVDALIKIIIDGADSIRRT